MQWVAQLGYQACLRTFDSPCVFIRSGDQCPEFRTEVSLVKEPGLAPIAQLQRLSIDGQGPVVYRYKQPFHDGTIHVVLEPLDFITRLTALVPRPRLNLTRFHGVFAPNFKHRAGIVPRLARGRMNADRPLALMTWAQRLKRAFAIDNEVYQIRYHSEFAVFGSSLSGRTENKSALELESELVPLIT